MGFSQAEADAQAGRPPRCYEILELMYSDILVAEGAQRVEVWELRQPRLPDNRKKSASNLFGFRQSPAR